MLSRTLVQVVAAALWAGFAPGALAQSSDLFSGFSLSPDLPAFDSPAPGTGSTQPAGRDPVPFGLPPGASPSSDALWLPLPYTSPQSGVGTVQPTGAEVVLEARLTQDSGPLSDGVVWRVFATKPDKDGGLPLVATAEGGTAAILLDPGSYFVHASFGRAGATKRLTVDRGPHAESLVLEAGALRFGAVVGDDQALPDGKVVFEVSHDEEDGARAIVVPDAKPGLVLRLNAGIYHVVSRYGTLNAVVRADIEVKPGKLTDAVIRHKAAEATLKLVAEAGGEALANTSWAVLTKGGDTIHESVGAFPRIVLAEGGYTAVARHKGRIYARDFTIESGVDRDVEVKLSDEVRTEADRRR
jgi:hypothetical protein